MDKMNFDTVTSEQVFEMIQRMYSIGGKDRGDVDTWLQTFQKTPYAWKISDELLYSDKFNSIETISFASQVSIILKDSHIIFLFLDYKNQGIIRF